ncbi:hypothetical protein BDQ17DRAFT_1323673 [Cyathus striatus]|nr:hypothetical protein BDQ17DRAFT_1323673 [Cyathus striatus]
MASAGTVNSNSTMEYMPYRYFKPPGQLETPFQTDCVYTKVAWWLAYLSTLGEKDDDLRIFKIAKSFVFQVRDAGHYVPFLNAFAVLQRQLTFVLRWLYEERKIMEAKGHYRMTQLDLLKGCPYQLHLSRIQRFINLTYNFTTDGLNYPAREYAQTIPTELWDHYYKLTYNPTLKQTSHSFGRHY